MQHPFAQAVHHACHLDRGRDLLVPCGKEIFSLLTGLKSEFFSYLRLSGGEYSQPINPQYSPTYWAWGR